MGKGANSVRVKDLTYMELLATIPWVALVEQEASQSCEWSQQAHASGAKLCKIAARLLYVDLDGSQHWFCHQHLHSARLDPAYELYMAPNVVQELKRNTRWQRHTEVRRVDRATANG